MGHFTNPKKPKIEAIWTQDLKDRLWDSTKLMRRGNSNISGSITCRMDRIIILMVRQPQADSPQT